MQEADLCTTVVIKQEFHPQVHIKNDVFFFQASLKIRDQSQPAGKTLRVQWAVCFPFVYKAMVACSS